jgi:LPS sulfotransferase NodH
VSRRGYVIASSPRSGATLLCDLLRQTRLAGLPDEYKPRSAWPGRYHAEYFWEFRDDRCTPNGVFGVKLMWFQLLELDGDIQYYGVSDHPERHARITHFLGNVRYVRLRRRTRIEQALSWLKARMTGQWAVLPDETPAGWPRPPTRVAVDRTLALLEAQEAAWDEFIAGGRDEQIEVIYEDLVGDPAATVARVFESLDLDTRPPAAFPTHLVSPRDAEIEQLARRYLDGEL